MKTPATAGTYILHDTYMMFTIFLRSAWVELPILRINLMNKIQSVYFSEHFP